MYNLQETQPIRNLNEKTEKHSPAFKYAIALIFYTLLYYYFYEVVDHFIGQAFTLSGFLVCAYFLFKYTKEVQIIILFTIGYLIVSIMISNLINVPNWGSCLSLLTVLSASYIFSRFPMSKRETNIMFAFFAVFVAFILLNCNIGGEFYENKFNPNSGGFLLSLLFCMVFVRAMKAKSTKLRVIWVLFALFTLLLQLVYISRTALLGCLFFCFVNLLFNASKKTVKNATMKKIILASAILGLFVGYLYSEILFKKLGYNRLIIFGKDLFTGREIIWNGAFATISENPWFGICGGLNADLVKASGNALLSNPHNQPIGIMAYYGIPTFILFYFLLAQAFVPSQTRISACLVVFIITIQIMSYFDVYYFSMYNIGPILLAFCFIKNFAEADTSDNSIYPNL